MKSRRTFLGLCDEVVQEKYRILTEERGLNDKQISELANQNIGHYSDDDVVIPSEEEFQDFVHEMECRRKQLAHA